MRSSSSCWTSSLKGAQTRHCRRWKTLFKKGINISPFVSGGDPCPKQTPRFHPNSPDEEPRSVSRDSAAFLQDFHVRGKTRNISLVHSSVFCQRVLYKAEGAGWRPLQNHLSNTSAKLVRGNLFHILILIIQQIFFTFWFWQSNKSLSQVNSKSVSDMLREVATVSPLFFKEVFNKTFHFNTNCLLQRGLLQNHLIFIQRGFKQKCPSFIYLVVLFATI